MCTSWRKITKNTIKHAWNALLPHLKLERKDLLCMTMQAAQQVPGMETVDRGNVFDMVEKG
ncbi:hypothetical protein E2C01_065946 [Portunus trituberculatus]|uniref:Uncharacterized protein n=1 Tax=Portunus trituberculatus TaxID=210409 RepID=A0A5B7HFX1_PORTR|nr:hypothetical protein [Portunus trituberculatus]